MCMRACLSVCVSSTCTHSEVASISPQTSPTEAQAEARGGGGGGGGGHEEETEEENRTEPGRKRRSPSTATPPREDQLDAVFQACDEAGKGKVSAGRLADSLSSRLSELQPRWLLGELRNALCSSGEEVELDLTTFRHILFAWLHENAAHLIPSTPNTTSPPHDSLLVTPDPSPTLGMQHQPTAHHNQYPSLQHQLVPPVDSGLEYFTTSSHPQHHSPPVQHQLLDAASEYSAIHHQPQHYLQHHSTLHSVGPLNSHDPLEEWLKDSPHCAPPFLPPPLPPPTPPPRSQRGPGSLRDTFEHHLSDPSRRSTLLPRVGGWGAASDDPPFTPLEDMANPPSPISHPRSLFNGAAPPTSPPPRLSPDDDAGSRSMVGGRGEHHPTTPYRPPRRHQLNQSLQRSLNYTCGSIEDEGGVTAPDPGELQQEVLELSYTNKRLTGENQELTIHLTTAEETNANLREQCVSLRHALQGVQQQLESARALEAEVEAARRQVEEGREERDQLLNHLAHVERDNTSLSTRLHGLAEQLGAAQEELEGRTQREEEAVRRHRDEVTRLSSQLAHWKAQAETQTLTAYRLQETLEDVKKLVEVLREEKRSLEEQLNHVKEELAAATHSESDLSGLDGVERRMALDSSSTEKSTDGSGLEASGIGVSPTAPTTPAVFTTATTNVSAAPTTPLTSLSQPSPSVNTPQSILSEIQTMGEDSGSLPFCEKIEGGSKGERRSGTPSEAGDSPLASVLASMLRWWREWEERGIPLLRAMLDKDTVTLHQHVAAHYEELVRLERELQDIRRATESSPATSGWASMEEAMKEGSVGSAQDSALPSSQATTPTLPKRRPRTPGSHVSQLIFMFESSSQSSSPVCSEVSEQPGSVEHPSSLSRMLMRERWQRRRSSDACTRSESTNSDDERSMDPTLRDSLENVRCEDSQNGHSEDTYDGRGLASGNELEVFSRELALDEAIGSENIDKERDCVFLEYGLDHEGDKEQDRVTKGDIDSQPSTIYQSQMDQDRQNEERTKDDIQIHPSITAHSQEAEERKEDVMVNGSTTLVEDHTLEPERDMFMETSHLMKLMNEVAEQRTIIADLREQVGNFEDERERYTATLQRLYRLVLQLFHDTRWTEGVRREWLAVVVPRVGGRGEEGEGAESLTPATPTHPLDEVPLTTSFSREEIEALISARRDPLPCDTRPSRDEDRLGHVSSPENLAAELEKELTALRVHVLRSHALLHHYQSSSSSSQYGSRAEVSTPALPPPPPVQGVEVGVECDLCGPTCVPRPCDSTATQTPASPLSITPDSEEPPTTTLLTTSSARREEEVEEERRDEEQEAAQQEEEGRKDKEDRARGRRPRTQQQRVKWKEDLEEEEEEDKEEERDINEGATKEEEKLLVSVGGGVQDPPHPQQRPQQQPQRPPAPRQVGALDLPEHRQLRQVEVVPPAHRTLRQLGVGKEEEEEQQEAGLGLEEGLEIIPMTSEHSLYSPKPAYDHLDHYRSGGQARGAGEEKLRRTGLSTVTPLMSSGSRETIPGPPRSRPRAQMELTPLSPPPSLDNVEEEDMEEEEEEEEEEPALPSTPESSSSLASGDMFPHPPQSPRGPPRLPRQLSMSAPDPPSNAAAASAKNTPTRAPLPEAAPPPAQPPHNEETQKEASTSEEGKKHRVFPSLHDAVIQMASLARGDPAFTPNENLSPQEIETKFTQLSLAFKTDRLTLRQRLDLQQRHRDTAEDNHEADMDCLRRLVLEIQAECTDSDLSDAISQVRRHLDVLATSSSRLVSISEVWGAVQQEWRLARAVEVIFRHVEDVKRKYESVKQELEELRGLLTEYKIELPVSPASVGGGRNSLQGSSDSPSTSRRLRALSLIDCANKAGSEKEGRRPSIAPKSSSSNPLGNRARSRRASLMADIRPFKEITFLAPVAAAAAATKESSSSSSTSSSSSGSSLPSRDRGEEGPGGGVQPPGRLNCVIAEEGSESGEEEGGGSSQDAASPTTATTTASTTTTTYTHSNSTSNLSPLSLADLTRLQAIAESRRLTDESDEGSSDDHSQSDFSQGSSAVFSEPAPASFPASLWNRLPSQHWLVVGTIQMLEWGSRLYALFSWLLVAIKEVLAWARGGQWPYSQQQTVLGARYACASLLLLAAAFLLLVTLSSGDASVPQPHHPGWTTMHHILHPFVTLRYLGPPPT